MTRRLAAIGRRPRTVREAGQSLVEFALILPAFLLILLSILDFGYFFYTDLTITYASREGARVGAALAAGNTALPCAKVDDYVMAAVQRVLESAGMAVDVNAGGGGGVNWVRIYKSLDASGGGYTTAGNYNEWTYSAGGGPTVDGRTLDFKGPATPSWSACSRLNGVTPDSLGVAIDYRYAWITPIAQIPTLMPDPAHPGQKLSALSTITFTDKTVMALNPTTP